MNFFSNFFFAFYLVAVCIYSIGNKCIVDGLKSSLLWTVPGPYRSLAFTTTSGSHHNVRYNHNHHYQSTILQQPIRQSRMQLRYSNETLSNDIIDSSSIIQKQQQKQRQQSQSLEERMRKLVLHEQELERRRILNGPEFPANMDIQTTTKTGEQTYTTKRQRRPNHIIEVTTLQQFHKVMQHDTTITAVRWYASWCKTCHAVEPAFYNMYNRIKDSCSSSSTTTTTKSQQQQHHYHQSVPVQFVDIPATNDRHSLHNSFQIPKVPFGHIYHPDIGLVEEMKLTIRTYQDFYLILQSYVDGLCTLPIEPNPKSGIYEAPYQRIQ